MKTMCAECKRLNRRFKNAMLRYLDFYEAGGLNADEKHCRQLHTAWFRAFRVLVANEQKAGHKTGDTTCVATAPYTQNATLQ